MRCGAAKPGVIVVEEHQALGGNQMGGFLSGGGREPTADVLGIFDAVDLLERAPMFLTDVRWLGDSQVLSRKPPSSTRPPKRAATPRASHPLPLPVPHWRTRDAQVGWAVDSKGLAMLRHHAARPRKRAFPQVRGALGRAISLGFER
jgi:hypothetical protein